MSALTTRAVLQDTRMYTYSDYEKWEDENRWELIDGVPQMMAAPTITHQRLLLLLGVAFETFLKGKKCRVIIAPVDVRLNHKTKDNTVLQPDVIVVCDPKKLEDGKSVKGAPDLAIEILSPSSGKHDKIVKFQLYKQAGVREYWIVDPVTETVAVHVLEDDSLGMRYYGNDEKIPVHVLEGCDINLSEIFEVEEREPAPLSPAQLAELENKKED